MAITSCTANTIGDAVYVEAASSLSGTVFFYWFRDGRFVVRTETPWMVFRVASGDQARIEVLDGADPDVSGADLESSTDGVPYVRVLWWVRSLDTDAVQYRIDQKEGTGSYTEIGRVDAVLGQWDYAFTTARLTDLTAYTWRVVPVDAAGNEDTALVIGPETVVRRPDAPAFVLEWDADADAVTIEETA